MWAHDPQSAQDMSTSSNLCSPDCCTSKSYPKASVLGWTLFPLLLLDNNCHCKSGRGNGQRGVCVCEQRRSKLSMDPQLVSREETLSLHNPPSPPKLTMALLLKLNLPMGDTASSNKPAFAATVKQFWSWLLKSEHTLHIGVISFFLDHLIFLHVSCSLKSPVSTYESETYESPKSPVN